MNTIKAKLIAVFVWLGVLTNTSLFGQTAQTAGAAEKADGKKLTLSVQDAVQLAEQNSRTLKSAQIDLEIKQRAAKYGWNVLLPTVQATGTMSRTTEYSPSSKAYAGIFSALSGGQISMPTDYADEEGHWSTIGGISASWNFTPAYVAKIKISKEQYEAGKVSWEQTQRETLTNIKKLYYGLLLQQESIKIQKQSLNNARERAEQAAANFRNGTVPELSLLQAQVTYENTKPEVESAEQALRQQIDLFAFMLGLPVGTEIELTSTIEPEYVDVTADELLAKYANNDLQIQSLLKTKHAAELGILASDLATWFPTIALSYSYQPVYIGEDGAWHFYKGIGKSDQWYDSGSFSASLVWNITNMLPWSANRQQVKDYKQQLAQLDLNLETLRENQKVNVRKAVDTLNQARAQIDVMGRSVTLAQRAYDMTARSYRNGSTELLDLRDAEKQLNQAKLGQLNQRFQYISALMDLENTLNTSLTAK
ncbi:MAG: TolC family protein [Treponema sp.]|nr:TolC family protein [Treponema sp.]